MTEEQVAQEPVAQDTPVGMAGSTIAVATGFLLAALLGGMELAREGSGSVRTDLLLSIGALTCAGLSILALVVRAKGTSQRTLVRIGPIWVVWYVISFGLTSLAWLFPQHGVVAVIDTRLVPRAVLLALLGLVIWAVGFFVGPPAVIARGVRKMLSLAAPGSSWSLRFPSIPPLLFALGAAARLTLLRGHTFGYLANASALIASPSPYTQALTIIGSLCDIGLTIAAIDLAFHPSVRGRLSFGVMLVAELAFGLVSGTKSAFFITVLGVATVFILANNGRVKRRDLVLTVLVVIIVFDFTGIYRRGVRRADGTQVSTSTALISVPKVLGTAVDPAHFKRSLAGTFGQIEVRTRQIDSLTIILQRTPREIPFLGSKDLVVAPAVALVPRAIWPSKPVLTTALDFGRSYFNVPSSLVTSTAITVPGDLYRHSGLLGLLLGMGMLGVAVRLVDEEVKPMSDSRMSIVFITLAVLLIDVESDVIGQLASALPLLGLSLLATRVAFRNVATD